MANHLHHDDLPDGLDLGPAIAVDTETMGLNPNRDRLCVVQLSAGDGDAHLVKLGPVPKDGQFNCPNLTAQLGDPKRLKLYHYARFDVAMLKTWAGIDATPIYCTKIASRLSRTNTNKHGLKDLCRDLLGVSLSKEQQTTDWGADELTKEQIAYAASDVLHLHALKEELDKRLDREGRLDLAQKLFDFLPTRAQLDLMGWEEQDLFSHS